MPASAICRPCSSMGLVSAATKASSGSATMPTGIDAKPIKLGPQRESHPCRRRVLFVCTGNSCRSQIAEAWARALFGDLLEPHSAGVVRHGLDPNAIAVMAEAGIDISAQRSKTIDELPHMDFDHVVTLSDRGRAGAALFWAPTATIHAGFGAPRLEKRTRDAGEGLVSYRDVRDMIRSLVESIGHSLSHARDVGAGATDV